MFRDRFVTAIETQPDPTDISALAKAAREALNAGVPFPQVERVLRAKGFRMEGDRDAFTVAPLFDLGDLDGDAVVSPGLTSGKT